MQPCRVGAIAPSGEALARLITQEVAPGSGPVIELGPGTGVFTSALLTRGVRAQDLTLVESDANLAGRLRRRYPGACVLSMDAAQLAEVSLFNGVPAGAAISGLPLLAISKADIEAILRGVFSHMTADAAFYQFTYGPACPVPNSVMTGMKLEARCIGRTLANIPPASVYRITQKA